MSIGFSGMALDIAILVILIISLIRGYKKGIVECVLHFAASLLILGLSWFLSKPASSFFTFEAIDGIDRSLIPLISPIVGRVIGFVIIFIVLSIIRAIVFVVLRSLIEGIKNHVSIVRWLDNGCGAIFNVAKNTLLIYVILIGLCMPVFDNGITVVNESKAGQVIMKVSPTISEKVLAFGNEIIAFTHVDEWANRDFNMKDMIVLLDAMVSMDVLQEDQLNQLYMQYQSQIDSIPSANVSSEEYKKLMETIELLPSSDQFKTVARSKIVNIE